ncbi:M14 family metallopeptidase [Psychromonas ossibalaenae]|uniref:M14 family metallopeptidase n=1 Tax=Psychromonas ossibalaenae TaxID=444922 RepID=UPI00036BC24D|nr:M14 family metallocarboxypeptidase [Psychromonas ossibalaenae]
MNQQQTPLKKWGSEQKTAWLSRQKKHRSYQDNVVKRLNALTNNFNLIQYGLLDYALDQYPLYAVTTRCWDNRKPTVLITGGVHGYESSGVHGSIDFLEKRALDYVENFNIIVAPCVSPWGYETINRWNPQAVDPNRSFYENSPSQEAACLIKYIKSLNTKITAHIDLHETTDTDNTEFRPALAARDALPHDNWDIPDGFYLVGDSENPADDFQRAIIRSVEKVTHIAPADDNGKIIGKSLAQHGVINYACHKLGLCIGFTNGVYSTTTEVYPDSPKVCDQDCVDAQIAAVSGGLDFLISQQN